MNIVQAMRDRQLFAPAFQPVESWRPWRVFGRALFGLPIPSRQDRALYRRCTAREGLPSSPAREAWVVCGRRAGKSKAAAAIAVYIALFCDHASSLSRGERGVVMCLASDRRQARVVLGYVDGILQGSPLLSAKVAGRRAEAIELTNGIVIECHTSSYRAVRGYSVVSAILDECAFWRSDEDTANPDVEIANALRPAMATIPGAMLIGISSPYARRGLLWQEYRAHWGRPGDVLVWQAPSRVMNSSVPAAVVERAYAEDESRAAAEYGAEFRRDIESFVSREAVEACVAERRRELPPTKGVRYFAFVDPSGGSADSMTLAIAHRDGERAAVDAVRERRPPFSPDCVVREFAELLRSYRVSKVRGDRYAGEWPRERFRAHGITYEPAERSKSDLYGSLLPAVNAGRIELLDHPRLLSQLCALERRTARGGRDSIDHAPGGHDDLANAVAGVAHELLGRRRALRISEMYPESYALLTEQRARSEST